MSIFTESLDRVRIFNECDHILALKVCYFWGNEVKHEVYKRAGQNRKLFLSIVKQELTKYTAKCISALVKEVSPLYKSQVIISPEVRNDLTEKVLGLFTLCVERKSPITTELSKGDDDKCIKIKITLVVPKGGKEIGELSVKLFLVSKVGKVIDPEMRERTDITARVYFKMHEVKS